MISINCLLLGKTSFDDTFAVNVVDNNKIIDKKDTLGINDPDIMKLWKVDIAESEEDRLKEFEEDNIVGAELMKPNCMFNDFFKKEELTQWNIHVIVQVPAAAAPVSATGPSQQGITYDTEKILKEILKDITKVPREMTKEAIGLLMPLKERDTSRVLHVITNNACGSLYPLTSKTDLNFLVCGGAPGIGKARWGIELFESLKHVWVPPYQWNKPHFLYFLLDFVNGVRLSEFDQNLSASIIIGLRIAYKYFAQDKLSFDSFKYTALAKEKSLNAFNITLVLDRIRSYSFVFVECPLLSTTAILEIVDYYANENGDKQQGWMTSASFLQILYDTN
ncbi:hypothetical protein RhiirA4_452422 [Rhizophagus irregularis]|uniref:Crinkler effector protein N-terminal domain-containing protein n=1 Tax=Rhizophagus irregularis TaxID=588596 RepID=A0A2I1FY03_9GLOM|nr:hypothetical protein RhiirA4_452422 [Rhizophagus irregularis]